MRTEVDRRSAAVVASTRLSDVGVSSAAPAACTTRAAISAPSESAAAHAAEAAMNTPTPTRKPRSRRRRSAIRPNSSSSAA